MNVFAKLDGLQAKFLRNTVADHCLIGPCLLKRLTGKTRRKFKSETRVLSCGQQRPLLNRADYHVIRVLRQNQKSQCFLPEIGLY